jgi:hypothetical protein
MKKHFLVSVCFWFLVFNKPVFILSSGFEKPVFWLFQKKAEVAPRRGGFTPSTPDVDFPTIKMTS